MKYFLLPIIFFAVWSTARAQKKVEAAADLISRQRDTITIQKGKSFVVQLPVHNRKNDDWVLEEPLSSKCKFSQSITGQAGMMPNQQEPKLMFFKAVETGTDSVRFIYKNSRPEPGLVPEIKTVIIIIQ